MYNDDTIVAIATASGIGSISIVRVSGAKALEIALKISQKTTINPRIATLSYLYDKKQNIIDEAIVLYFKSLPKVEISFATSIEEHARNYLGSEISLENIESSILFHHTGNALHYFQQITNNKMAIKPEEKENLIDKFLYEFESCSNAHRRSDGYQFYFFYNNGLPLVFLVFFI